MVRESFLSIPFRASGVVAVAVEVVALVVVVLEGAGRFEGNAAAEKLISFLLIISFPEKEPT